MAIKKPRLTKEEIEQRRKDGKIAFEQRKKELYEEYCKKYSHIILNTGKALSITIKVEVGKDLKYIPFISNDNMLGYWLIPKKYYDKAVLYAEFRNLIIKDISYILKL